MPGLRLTAGVDLSFLARVHKNTIQLSLFHVLEDHETRIFVCELIFFQSSITINITPTPARSSEIVMLSLTCKLSLVLLTILALSLNLNLKVKREGD